MDERFRPLVGWAAIAQATPYSAETLRKVYARQLKRAGVVVFHMVGRPPRSRPHAYPEALAQFFSTQAGGGAAHA